MSDDENDPAGGQVHRITTVTGLSVPVGSVIQCEAETQHHGYPRRGHHKASETHGGHRFCWEHAREADGATCDADGKSGPFPAIWVDEPPSEQ